MQATIERIRQHVVNPAIAKVRRADRIAVTPGGQRPGQQFVKVTTDTRNLLCIEDSNAGQVAVAIKSCYLLRGQSCGMLGSGRVKPQIAVKLAQFVAARNEPLCSQWFQPQFCQSVYRPDTSWIPTKCNAKWGNAGEEVVPATTLAGEWFGRAGPERFGG